MEVRIINSDKEKINLTVILKEECGHYFPRITDKNGRPIYEKDFELLGTKFSVEARGELTGSLYTEYTLPEKAKAPLIANAIMIDKCGSHSLYTPEGRTRFREAQYVNLKI
ncbi:MAG: hypothetical protein ABIF18_01325 [archaeon]